GGVTSIPAAVAVFSLVRFRVFGAYLGFALLGAVIAGMSFGAYAS
ncbi:MAG: permease, partial [Pseudomonadota bacterium]